MHKFMILAAAAALAFTTSVALAQDKAKVKTPPKPRTAISLECSKQADAKGLKGKARKKFRASCKRNLAKAPATK